MDEKTKEIVERLRLGGPNASEISDEAASLIESLSERVERLSKLDREAATYVESVICMRTRFTGDPPYVGWKGLGLALNEELDEKARLSERVGELDDAFENVEMQIVDGPTDGWVMLPKIEWENIKRALLSKQEERKS